MTRVPAARVMLIGLDACDPDLVRGWTRDGRLPALGTLLDRGAVTETKNPFGVLESAIWPCLVTGRTATEHGYHCWDEIAPGSYEWRETSADDIDGVPVWEVASRAGRRVAVLDVPHSKVSPVNGVMVSEWATHDCHFGLRSWPPDLVEEIVARDGHYPVQAFDPMTGRERAHDDYVHRSGAVRTPAEDEALLADLLAGVERKAALSRRILDHGGWDLFVTVFSESHAVGHHLWHLHDPGHPRHDPPVARSLGDAVLRVYEALDCAVQTLLDGAGPAADTLVLLSHGMGPHYDGSHLLDTVLRRLGPPQGAERDHGGGIVTRVLKRGYERAPVGLRRAAAPLVAARLRARGVPAAGTTLPVSDPAAASDRARRPFYAVPNNWVYGGVRFNLAGREPNGMVQPGPQLRALTERVQADLLALVNVDTGEPVVRAVEVLEDHHGRIPPDSLPDLFVEWDDRAPITTVWSARIGIVHQPMDHWRTGNHRPDGLLLRIGPGTEAGPHPAMACTDLAPLLESLLGIAPHPRSCVAT